MNYPTVRAALLGAAVALLCAAGGAKLETPFTRLSDTGAQGFTTSNYDADVYARFERTHARQQATRMHAVPLPGGLDVTLELTPFDIWEDGGTAVVVNDDGSEERVAPSVRLFRVRVPGRASVGFIGAAQDMLHGYLQLEGEPYVFSTGQQPGTPLAISHGSLFDIGNASEWCRVATAAIQPMLLDEIDPVASSRAPSATIRTLKIFIDVDAPLRKFMGSNQASIDYATLLAGASSDIYRRDLGVRFSIPNGYIRVWNSSPWSALVGPLAAQNYSKWWRSAANPNRYVPRALVHGLTRHYSAATGSYNFGFAASIGGTCSNKLAYCVSSLEGTFPYPVQHTAKTNGDLFLFCHESGHVFGSRHTFEYSPPIRCNDGTGPDKGTLMSYCYNNFGIVGVGMRFHKRVQNHLRSQLDAKGCVAVQNIQSGDYDVNGILDMRDLGEFDRYSSQGFVSLGARETFDMNGDGQVDAIDRAVLLGMIIPPATSGIFNGSGTNCLCFGPVTQPVLGGTWTTVVGDGSGPSYPTLLVVGSGVLAAPLSTKIGEVLISLDGNGGQTLLTSWAMTSAGTATHAIPLPNDPAFVGLGFAAQAALFKSGGCQLVNGLSLVVSTYE